MRKWHDTTWKYYLKQNTLFTIRNFNPYSCNFILRTSLRCLNYEGSPPSPYFHYTKDKEIQLQINIHFYFKMSWASLWTTYVFPLDTVNLSHYGPNFSESCNAKLNSTETKSKNVRGSSEWGNTKEAGSMGITNKQTNKKHTLHMKNKRKEL